MLEEGREGEFVRSKAGGGAGDGVKACSIVIIPDFFFLPLDGNDALEVRGVSLIVKP